MRVTFSDDASFDITEIVEFGTEAWGEPAAQAYVGRIGEALDRLRDHPAIGSVVEEAPAFRRWSVGSHVIFYRLDDAELLILRVLHSSQDFERHLP